MNQEQDDTQQIQVIRPNTLYVSWQTYQALGYVAGAMVDTKRDGLADKILADWLREQQPEVIGHLKMRYQADSEFKKALQVRFKTAPPF